MTSSSQNAPDVRLTVSGWWYVVGVLVGGAIGAVGGTVLTLQSFFHFLAARLGPLYNGEGESGLYSLWVLPVAPIWGFVTGGALVCFAIYATAYTSKHYTGGDEWSRAALRWVYGIIAALLLPAIFWGGCVVLGFALQLVVQLLSPAP